MIDVTMANFEADVIAASQTTPVLVDFWADWCGPCKSLGPILEKLETAYDGRFKLVKINADTEQQLAGAFGVKSLPTCILLMGGRPVDGFMGALPEGKVREFLDKHLPSLDELVAQEDVSEAEALLAQGDTVPSRGITTTSVAIEELNGQLNLIPNTPRGGPVAQNTANKRKVRTFSATHLPLEDTILAEAIQNVREFGSENTAQGAATVVNTRLIEMRQKHEATLEFHRLGAIKGIILDSDGVTVISNLFTVFGLAQTTIDFQLDVPTTEIALKTGAVRRAIDSAIGGTPYDHIHVFCSSGFFDSLVTLASVKDAWKYQQSQMLRTDLGRKGNTVTLGDVTFEEMSRTYAGITPIATNEAIAFPVGAPGLFLTRFAPGNFVEAANTIGKRFYARQELLRYGRGVGIYTESNPLNVCTRPEVLIKLTV